MTAIRRADGLGHRARRRRPGHDRADVTEAALARIAAHNPMLNAFTDVTAERARAKARADRCAPSRAGKTPGRSPACRSR